MVRSSRRECCCKSSMATVADSHSDLHNYLGNKSEFDATVDVTAGTTLMDVVWDYNNRSSPPPDTGIDSRSCDIADYSNPWGNNSPARCTRTDKVTLVACG